MLRKIANKLRFKDKQQVSRKRLMMYSYEVAVKACDSKLRSYNGK